MGENNIRGILEKYWEGETTLEEEKELRSYFASSQVSEEFAPYTPLFAYFDDEQHIQMEAEISQPKLQGGGRIVNLKWAINVAASIAIFIAMYFVNKQISSKNNTFQYAYHDTYQTPEEALEEVKQALFYVSSKMNKGVNTTTQSLEKMEPLSEIINSTSR